MSETQLPERDNETPAELQGMLNKFIVRRCDGADKYGQKHHDCDYFVLDVTHDQHAKAALRAYAMACRRTHPFLSADMVERYNLDVIPLDTPPDGYFKADADGDLVWEEGCISLEPEYDDEDEHGNVTSMSRAFFLYPPDVEKVAQENWLLRDYLRQAEAQLELLENLLSATGYKPSDNLAMVMKRINTVLMRTATDPTELL